MAELNKMTGPNWDVDELLIRLDGDHEFLCELLKIFREDSAASLQKAKVALRERNMPELTRVAHTMKGMLRNLSMHRAAEIAYALETASREENGIEAEASFARLERACMALLPEVAAQLAGVQA